jgi:hypothetical protein
MTEIPHLIREKVKDYLNAIYLLEWRIKMDMICLEYKKKTSCYYDIVSIAGFFYNYRYYRVGGCVWSNSDVCNKKNGAVCKLSPNY